MASAAAEPADPRVEQLVERIMTSVEEQAGHGRFGVDYDLDAVRRSLTARIRAGTDQETLSRWLNDELAAAALGFAEITSARPSKVPYAFPFSEDIPRLLVRAWWSGSSTATRGEVPRNASATVPMPS